MRWFAAAPEGPQTAFNPHAPRGMPLSSVRLPEPRGNLSEYLFDRLSAPPEALVDPPRAGDDVLAGEDFQLALYACYELHYRSFDDVADDWEWEPSLLAFRAGLERAFERRLREASGPDAAPRDDTAAALFALIAAADGPSVSRFLETRGTLDHFRELAVHRSAYQLKEADPHSWAIPRLTGPAKVALVEIQADEYGGGRADRLHSQLFANTMEALGLEGRYGAYLDHIPGSTLATVNVMSLFGLHRRLRGAIVGHLAAVEIDSSVPNRRYANGLRRLGLSGAATDFYDEHVEADAVHENLAAHDLAGSLARDQPELAGDILFGARAMLLLDEPVTARMLDRWSQGRTSLLRPLGAPVAV